MTGLTDKKLSGSLHRDIRKGNIHFPQAEPPTGQCKQIKCFLDRRRLPQLLVFTFFSALFTSNSEPKAEKLTLLLAEIKGTEYGSRLQKYEAVGPCSVTGVGKVISWMLGSDSVNVTFTGTGKA